MPSQCLQPQRVTWAAGPSRHRTSNQPEVARIDGSDPRRLERSESMILSQVFESRSRRLRPRGARAIKRCPSEAPSDVTRRSQAGASLAVHAYRIARGLHEEHERRRERLVAHHAASFPTKGRGFPGWEAAHAVLLPGRTPGFRCGRTLARCLDCRRTPGPAQV
jgi:hypothetical protein